MELNETEGTALVTVPDKQLSLAIGKEGQNARLAAKLTGWRIDIRSASSVEAEKTAKVKEQEPQVETAEAEPATEPEAVETQPVAEVETEFTLEEEVVEEEPAKEEEAVPITDFKLVLTTANAPSEQGTSIRFAEDVLPSKAGTTKRKSGKGKKDSDIKAREQKPKKSRPKRSLYQEDEDEYEV